MICSSCGSQVDDGFSFCTNCGARLSAPVDVAGDTSFHTPEPLGTQPVAQEAPVVQAAPAQQDFAAQAAPIQSGFPDQNASYAQANSAPTANPGPVVTPNVANMPSKGLHIACIVIGFLCGILWGVIGLIQYGPMKRAIESGDVETANKKANVIKIVTAIGVILNIFAVIGMSANG